VESMRWGCRVPQTMWVPQSFAHFANDWAFSRRLMPDAQRPSPEGGDRN
jgi:hypothetical protein